MAERETAVAIGAGGRIVTCTDHPDVPLVRLYSYAPVDVSDRLWQCIQAGHAHHARHRCAWCGGPVLGRREGGQIARPYRAVYCRPAHRLAAWREARRRRDGRVPR